MVLIKDMRINTNKQFCIDSHDYICILMCYLQYQGQTKTHNVMIERSIFMYLFICQRCTMCAVKFVRFSTFYFLLHICFGCCT